MPKTIQVQSSQVDLPPICVVCAREAEGTYALDKIFTHGRRSFPVTVNLPMCTEHLAQAREKSAGEIAAGRAGFYGGIFTGLLAGGGLFAYWSTTGQGSLVLNLFLALVLGTGFFLTIWVGAMLWLSPHLASRDAKAARNSVRLTGYIPQSGLLDLTFENEAVADMVEFEMEIREAR